MSAHNDSNKQPESISDPRRDLGLIPGSSRIEIKWCIRSENMDEEDVVRAGGHVICLNSLPPRTLNKAPGPYSHVLAA